MRRRGQRRGCEKLCGGQPDPGNRGQIGRDGRQRPDTSLNRSERVEKLRLPLQH